MAQVDRARVSALATLGGGVRVEAHRQFIRFYGGRFEGRHRWPDYTTFIEPALAPWERERVYALWVRALGATHYVPSWASPVMGGQAP
jgi:hypothetical protein